GDATISNTTKGVVLASGTAAHVELAGATIIGGALKTTGTGAVIDIVGGTTNTLDGTAAGNPVNNTGAVHINGGSTLVIEGTINNTGTISLDFKGAELAISGDVRLTGAGHVTLQDNRFLGIDADGNPASLTNVGNVISGAGAIFGGLLTIDNQAAG